MTQRASRCGTWAAAACIAACIAATAQAAPKTEVSAAQRDGAGVIASDQMVDAAAAWCDRASPAEGAKLRSAQAQWRQRQGVDGVRERMPAAARSAMSADAMRRLHERMAAQGQPAKACTQMTAALGSAEMNLRERWPGAYAAAPSAAAPSAAPAAQTATATSAAADTRPAAPGARAASGTLLLNPAQLSAIVERTPYVKGRSPAQRLEAAGLAGTIAIKGRVVKRNDRFYIEHQEDAFRSRLTVSPGIDLKNHEGRDVVVAGRLDEWPSSIAWLRDARLIDGSGLKPSAEPTAAGMMRTGVETDRIRAAPGKGAAPGDIAGVLYHGRGATGANGLFTFKEDVTVLFRDGWAYNRLDVPPSDLNVKVSREVEPQHWGKWRRAGGGYEVQWLNDQGRAKGEWQTAGGTLKPPWPAGTRLAGAYVATAFHGSIGLGGMYFKNTHIFRADGGWEDSRFAQGYSGGMAANNGFNSSTTSHSDKKGTSSVSSTTSSAGQATPPPLAAPGVTVTSNSKRDDGAQHRGRYTINGYTLEIRRDDGSVDRLLTFKSLGEGDVWIGSRTFSLPKK